MNNQHRDLSYYFKDNTFIDSKLVALEYEKIKREECNFYYYDSYYDSLNWKVEPLGSLQSHYVNQARRLRDNFDYLVLCYSGGIDSTNVLETFCYNNIKLDKIVTLGAFSQDSTEGDDTNHNGEVYHNVFPYIKRLGLENIFQTLDYTKEFSSISKFTHVKSKEWIENSGNWFSPHQWIWKDIHNYVVPQEYKNKKVAIILGRDKPTLYVDGDDYYFRFIDGAINCYSFYNGRDNIKLVNFYWDPGYPWILLKQLHILKKFFSLNRMMNLDFDRYRMAQTVGGVSIHSLIYDLKVPLSFVGKKSQTGIISIRDTYLKSKTNSDVYDIYSAGIKQLHSRLGSLNVPNRHSKRYYIT